MARQRMDKPPADMCGWLEMRTMLGWSLRWCELRGRLGQFIRSHDKDDRTTRKLSDLRGAVVTLEPEHSQPRYLEVAYARSPEAGVHTLRLRASTAQEALSWMKAIQKAQQYHVQNQPGTSKSFTVRKEVDGTIGLFLKRATINKIDPGGPADVAGLRVGMTIVRVCDTMIKLNDEMMTARSISGAPRQFEIEVKVPKALAGQSGAEMRHAVPRQVLLLAFTASIKQHLGLDNKTLQTVSAFLNEGTKVLVVLWGWGSTVESRHVVIPGYDITATDVHQILNADSKWLSAREGASAWDSKAVYFAGPSAGPNSGRQTRIVPSEPLASCLGWGTGKGLALHMVSVESQTHLRAFVASTESGLSPVRRKNDDDVWGGGAVSREDHLLVVQEKDAEIARLKKIISGMREQLSELRSQSGIPPWDEEEPSIVAELRDKVVAAGTLEELESVDFPEGEAGFFTPVGTPTNSDHWGGVDEQVMGRASPLLDDEVSISNCSWVGPPQGRRVGVGVVSTRPRGPIDDMPAMSASEGWAEGWHLRNVGYKKTGEKIPSLDSLYTFVGVDLFRSKDPLCNVARHFKLPSVDFDTHGLPPCFVFNLQIPFCEAPGMWGQSGGPTVNAIVTFSLRKMTADEVDSIPQARLMRQMYKEASEKGSHGTSAPFLGRFKMLARAEKGVPRMFSRYNGKPVLVTRSGTLYRAKDYLEVDCNFRSWAYAARTALYSMWGALSQFKVHVGLCIEARDDKEMPERIIGCCQMSNFTMEDAPEWDGEEP
eukprot:TRINITY_DN37259_c0_g1_i1.p1 TRINITY_DN37259_c0_g1~~TRINITY_DN37259_c0_g1_i1.p1  ORF type:complete len:789 (+),score=256.32 TRINITY_DN37259_c0_g1_i1:64-2367(+)